MVSESLDRAVFVAIIEHRPVVAADHDQGTLVEIAFLEGLDQCTDRPIQLHDRISSGSVRSRAREPLMHNPWDMQRMRTKVQKERFVAMRSDPRVGLASPMIGKILVSKTSLRPPRVEPDSANAVMDRRVVAMRPIHLQRTAMG